MVEHGYKTSSEYVLDIIKRNGLNAFVIRKIKIFETSQEVYSYETKYLRKVGAAKNDVFINKHNNGMFAAGTDEYKDMMTNKYGFDHNMKVPEIQHNRIAKINKRWGSYSNMLIYTNVNYKSSVTLQEKYGVSSSLQLPHAIEARKKSNLEKYGVENAFDSEQLQKDMKIKSLITFKNNYNNKQQPTIQKLLQSDINFSEYGWASKASIIIGISNQKVRGWMIRNMPNFYDEKCFKRKPKK